VKCLVWERWANLHVHTFVSLRERGWFQVSEGDCVNVFINYLLLCVHIYLPFSRVLVSLQIMIMITERSLVLLQVQCFIGVTRPNLHIWHVPLCLWGNGTHLRCLKVTVWMYLSSNCFYVCIYTYLPPGCSSVSCSWSLKDDAKDMFMPQLVCAFMYFYVFQLLWVWGNCYVHTLQTHHRRIRTRHRFLEAWARRECRGLPP